MTDRRSLLTERPWLILPVESNLRELDARVLLGAVAAERGFGAVIGRASDERHYLPRLPAAVVVQMSLVFPHMFELARTSGHASTALDEEGLIYRDQRDYLHRRVSVRSLEQCSRFFAWGDVHRKVVASRAPHVAERIVAVGNPRMDLLRSSVRGIYNGQAERLRNTHGRFILVNTNLGTYNNQLGPQARAREWAFRGWDADDGGAELLQDTIAFQKRLLAEFVELIRSLSAALPSEVSIVLRPHPSERLETWQEFLGQTDRVRYIRQGNVIPWIIASEALIHNGCTTGIEAALLGHPSFAYTPVSHERVECALPNDVSQRIGDRNQLLDVVRKVVTADNGDFVQASLATLREHVANTEGPLASEAIMDQIEQVAPGADAIAGTESIRASMHLGRAYVRARSFASGVIHRNLRAERAGAAVIRRASPHIHLRDISLSLMDLQGTTGRFKDVTCAPLGPDLIVIGQAI